MDANLQLEIPGKRNRPVDLVNFVLRRGPWMFVLGLLLFLLVSPAAFVLSKPYFRTSGRLLLTQKVKMFLDRQEQMIHGDFRDFAATYGERLVGQAVTRKALEGLPRSSWPDFIRGIESVEVAARVLSKRIAVIPVGRSYLMEVAMTSGSSKGMAETLNCVMRAFLELLESEQAQDCDRRLTYLEKELSQLRLSLEDREAEREKLAQELGHGSFSAERNPFYDLLIAVQSQHERARTSALEMETLLDRAKRDQELLSKQDATVFADEAVANNQAIFMIDNWTYQKLQDLRAGIDGLTEANDERIYVEQRMEAMNAYLEKFKKDLHVSALTIIEKKRAHELDAAVTKAQSAAQASADFEANLREQLDETREAFAKSSLLVNRGKELNEDLVEIKGRISRVQDRMREVHLEAKLPVHVVIDQLAVAPVAPEGDNFGKLVMMLFAGAMGAVAIVFSGLELLDNRMRSPGDVRAALGALPADPIPSFGFGSDKRHFASCVRDMPSHPCSVAIRSLALRLERERTLSKAKVFLFSGGEGSAGVSWLCRNCADALTQYVDKVLVLRLDQEDWQAGAGGGALGFSFDRYFDEIQGLLCGDGDAVTCLHVGAETPLMRRRDWLRNFITRVSPNYDVVLIDARPLLESDLTIYLAECAQVAVMVSREGVTHYSPFRKSIEFLVRLRVPAMTGVLVGRTVQPWDCLVSLGGQVIECHLPALGRLATRMFYASRKRILALMVWMINREQVKGAK